MSRSASMVLCIEPILAPPHPDGGLAGIFVFEQQVLVTADGCEVLSGALPATLWEHVTAVLYVSPMPYGANAAVTRSATGSRPGCAGNGAELRVAYADFASRDWREQTRTARSGRAPTPASTRS